MTIDFAGRQKSQQKNWGYIPPGRDVLERRRLRHYLGLN